MATKLSNTIQLSKNTLLGTTEMFSVRYDVNYHEDSEKAVVIAENIQLFCNQTNRNIIEDDVLKSGFLRMICRHDAQKVNWGEKLKVLRFKQQRLLDNASHSIGSTRSTFSARGHKRQDQFDDPAHDELTYDRQRSTF